MTDALSQERIGELAAAIVMALYDNGVKTPAELAKVLAVWRSIGESLPVALAIVAPVTEAIRDVRKSLDDFVQAHLSS